MQNIREKYIIGIGLSIMIYLVWRLSNLYIDVLYDHIILNYLLFCIWFIVFNNRLFVMTRKRLCKYYLITGLRYKSLLLDDKIYSIYVNIIGCHDWYKLDNILTIENGCTFSKYNEFISKNSTVNDLLCTMNDNADNLIIGNRYRVMKTDYVLFKYMSLIFLIIFELLYWLIYFK